MLNVWPLIYSGNWDLFSAWEFEKERDTDNIIQGFSTELSCRGKHCKALGSGTIKNNLLQSSTGKDIYKQRKSKLTESKTPFDTDSTIITRLTVTGVIMINNKRVQ